MDGSFTSYYVVIPLFSFQEKFRVILEGSELYSTDSELLERLWGACHQALYSLAPRQRQLGLGEDVSIKHSHT